MFEIVRQDLQRGGRLNRKGAGDVSSTGRIGIGRRVATRPNSAVMEEVAHHFLVFGNSGRLVRKLSLGRKLAKVGAGSPRGSVSSQLATC